MKIIYKRETSDTKDMEYVRQLADMQFRLRQHEGNENFYYVPGSNSVSPWRDMYGNELTDKEAVNLYGLEKVCNFVNMVETRYIYAGAPELIEAALTNDGRNRLYFFSVRHSGIDYDMTESTKRPGREHAFGDPDDELREREEREL